MKIASMSTLLLCGLMVGSPAFAATSTTQAKGTPAKGSVTKDAVPRTPDGKPDFSGVWSNASVTDLSRPPGVTKLVVNRTEAEALVKADPFQKLLATDEGPSDPTDDLLKDGNSDRGYNAFWIDLGNFLGNVKGEYRTSWIVDPADGQMPLSAAARARIQADEDARQQRLFHGPEALPLSERCLIGFSGVGGPGMLNAMYNSNYQIIQSAQSMLIVVEMVHDVRAISIHKSKAQALKAHRPPVLNLWLGDSVGWWEGDTLVVHTTNVNPTQARSGPIYLSEQGSVTERFTRTSPQQIFYEVMVDDANYYTQPWRAEISLNARDAFIYEYACHEGNYAMEGTLRGARHQEAQGIKPTEGPGIFGTPIIEKTKTATEKTSAAN